MVREAKRADDSILEVDPVGARTRDEERACCAGEDSGSVSYAGNSTEYSQRRIEDRNIAVSEAAMASGDGERVGERDCVGVGGGCRRTVELVGGRAVQNAAARDGASRGAGAGKRRGLIRINLLAVLVRESRSN